MNKNQLISAHHLIQGLTSEQWDDLAELLPLGAPMISTQHGLLHYSNQMTTLVTKEDSDHKVEEARNTAYDEGWKDAAEAYKKDN